jgi:hypothetical protein
MFTDSAHYNKLGLRAHRYSRKSHRNSAPREMFTYSLRPSCLSHRFALQLRRLRFRRRLPFPLPGQSPLRTHPLAWLDLSPFLATHPRNRRKSIINAPVSPLLATHTKTPPVTPFPATDPRKGGGGPRIDLSSKQEVPMAERLGLAEMLWSCFLGQEKGGHSQAACIPRFHRVARNGLEVSPATKGQRRAPPAVAQPAGPSRRTVLPRER